MSYEIHTYSELRKQVREALLRQHPEWIDAKGESPRCDSYEARLTELLAILTPRENASQLESSQ